MLIRYPPRLPEFVDRSRKLAREVLSSLEVRGAFLAGAPFAGLGTPMSDVDLHVVMTEPPDRAADQLMVDGQRVDLRYWSETQFRQRIELCTRYTVSEVDQSQLSIVGRRMLDPVVRFALGEVLADDGVLAGFALDVAAGESEMVKLAMAAMATEVANHVEDAKGFIEIGEDGPATYASRQALLAAAEAYLAVRGDIYLGQKWVWTRWERTVGAGLGSEVRDLVLAKGDLGRHDAVQHLWLAQDLFLLGIVGRSYPVVVARRPDMPCRDPYAVPVATADAVLLLRPGRKTARVSLPGAVLWAVAHGRTRAEAVEVTHDLLAAAGQRVSLDDVNRYYGTFGPVGLLTTDAVGSE